MYGYGWMWVGMLVGMAVCMGEGGCWWVWLYVFVRMGMGGYIGGCGCMYG